MGVELRSVGLLLVLSMMFWKSASLNKITRPLRGFGSVFVPRRCASRSISARVAQYPTSGAGLAWRRWLPPRLGAYNRRTMSVSAEEKTRKSWEELGVESEDLLQSLEHMGLEAPNDLQVRAVPSILRGRDVVLSSYTGSGKTVTGLVPLLSRILLSEGKGLAEDASNASTSEPKCRPKFLIITPSRELNMQILRVLEDLTGDHPSIASVREEDHMTYNSRNALNEMYLDFLPEVLVETPKQLLLLHKQGAITFDDLRYLMLDEVDMLVDTDKARLNRLFDEFPKAFVIQKVLASASALAHPEMKKFISSNLRPEFRTYNLSEGTNGGTDLTLPPTLEHGVLEVRDKDGNWATTVKNPEEAFPYKFKLLRHILNTRNEGESTLVFVHKKSSSTKQLLEELRYADIDAELLSGTRRVQKRNMITWQLMEGDGRVVVATDELAARGLDYESVSMVINFDLPYGVKNYLHRAGRAGRAGRSGTVISMVSNPKELRFLREKLFGRLGVEREMNVIVKKSEISQSEDTEDHQGLNETEIIFERLTN